MNRRLITLGILGQQRVRRMEWYNKCVAPAEQTAEGDDGGLNMKWRVVLEQDKETGEWAIWVPELPGCVSAGDTEEEALHSIKEAIALCLHPDPISVSPDAIVTEIAA